MNRIKLKLAGGTAGLAVVIGGGAALAADKLSPTQESDAIVADAAKELGVTSAKLEAALQQALENRVDAAVADGRLTEAQATVLKERIAAGEVPLIGLGPGAGHHGGHDGGHLGFVDISAAATFVGLSEDALRTRLENGDTLAEIAKAEGKTAAGLVDALVAAAKADLDEKVAEGRLTEAERTSILADLESRIEDVVNGEAHFGFRGGFGGPRPDDAPDA
jgi:transposase-like protein